MFCEQCGARNPADSRFCEKCGRPLASAVGAPPAAAIPPVAVAAPALAAAATHPQPARARSGGKGALVAVAALVGVLLIGAGAIAFSGALGLGSATGTRVPGSPSPSPASGVAVAPTSASAPTRTVVVAASAVVASPTIAPRPTSAPPATIAVTSVPDRLKPVEVATAIAPPKPPAPTTKPNAPTAGDATQMVANDTLGIRVWGPSSWQVIQNVNGPSEGQIAFLANAAEQNQGLFARSGLIAFEVFPLPAGTEVSPDDFFMGFLDGLMMEFSTSVSGDGEVGEYTLTPQKNSRYPGATTTFTISSSKGKWRYFWANHRIPSKSLSVQVYCGAVAEKWDAVAPICQNFYGMIETTK